MRKNVLITGVPRSGKSTLLKKIIQQFDQKVGFITNEIREDSERVGFEMETHTGEKFMLASVNFETKFKVSKYFVNIENLDLIISRIEDFKNDDFLFLDEVGQMELFSGKFKTLVEKYLDSSNICVATISKVYNDEFIEDIKKRNDIFLIEITEKNRNEKEEYLKALLRKIAKAKRYILDSKRFLINKDRVSIRTDHGIRNLIKQKEWWACDCEFFQENKVCSHIIALEEYLKKYK